MNAQSFVPGRIYFQQKGESAWQDFGPPAGPITFLEPGPIARVEAEFHVDPGVRFAPELRVHAAAVARYAVAAVRDAWVVLGCRTFLLSDFYVHPVCIKGHGRGAQVVFHRVHEPADMERKLGLAKFLHEATPQERY